MKLLKRVFRTPMLTFLMLAGALAVAAQPEQPKPSEASYEAVLQVLIAGGQGGQGTALPSSLDGISRGIRSEFGSANLRVIHTYFGRLSTMGTLESKGVSNAYAPEAMPGSPTFLEWTLAKVRNIDGGAGQPAYQIQGFRFGARVPVRVGTQQDEKVPAPINYESIGLTVDRVSVRENMPTLIGTLTQPRTDGTLFLILTIRNADR